MANERTDTATMTRKAIATEVRAEIGRQQKSQREVAELLGMTVSSLHPRLKGTRAFRAEELVLLADAFGIPVGRLLGVHPAVSA